MTLKDELMMFWVFCVVLITFVARHFFSGAVFLVEHVAATSVVLIPGLLHHLAGHLH
jgi:hypothetical protein